MSFWQEFKQFAIKGNAIDMAVGIVLGAAFNNVVQSLVNDVIMPPLGMLIGQVDFKDLKYVLQPGMAAVTDPLTNVVTTPAVVEVAIRYGMFINKCIDFTIMALTIFMMIKLMNRLAEQRVNLIKELNITEQLERARKELAELKSLREKL